MFLNVNVNIKWVDFTWVNSVFLFEQVRKAVFLQDLLLMCHLLTICQIVSLTIIHRYIIINVILVSDVFSWSNYEGEMHQHTIDVIRSVTKRKAKCSLSSPWLTAVPCWSLDSTHHHSGPPAQSVARVQDRLWGLSSWRLSRGDNVKSGERLTTPPEVIHETLHGVELRRKISQTVLQGIELLIEVSQSVWQGLDAEKNRTIILQTYLTVFSKTCKYHQLFAILFFFLT